MTRRLGLRVPLSPRAYTSVPSHYDQLQRRRREHGRRMLWQGVKGVILVCGTICVLTGATIGLIVLALICLLLEKL